MPATAPHRARPHRAEDLPRAPDRARAAGWGLAVAVAVLAASVLVPWLTGWDVVTRNTGPRGLAPLHGYPEVKLGPGTVPAVLLAVLGTWGSVRAARALRWSRLLVVSFLVALAWLLALALVDGPSGLSRVLGNPYEYLRTAREFSGSVGVLLETYTDRIPYTHDDNWPIHIAGHPPGAVLVFIGLVKLGLGGDLAAGVVVTVVAATLPAAVLTTLRVLGDETGARRAAPFLVLSPAAVFLAVSADAVFAVVAAWGFAALAAGSVAGAHRRRGAMVGWSLLAGVLLGYCVMMSYGLALLGLLALAVLWLGRCWWPLPLAAAAALAVVLGFAAAGFVWWEAFPVLVDRYWEGVAQERPASYWAWGNLGALLFSAGVVLGAGVGQLLGGGLVRLRGQVPHWWPGHRPVALLGAAAVATIVVAEASLMSKAEVERIWLPFIPWLTLTLALLPDRWHRPALAVQVTLALVVQHLLYTSW